MEKIKLKSDSLNGDIVADMFMNSFRKISITLLIFAIALVVFSNKFASLFYGQNNTETFFGFLILLACIFVLSFFVALRSVLAVLEIIVEEKQEDEPDNID